MIAAFRSPALYTIQDSLISTNVVHVQELDRICSCGNNICQVK